MQFTNNIFLHLTKKIFVQFLNISSFYEENVCNLCQNNSPVYKERFLVIYDEEKKVAIY